MLDVVALDLGENVRVQVREIVAVATRFACWGLWGELQLASFGRTFLALDQVLNGYSERAFIIKFLESIRCRNRLAIHSVEAAERAQVG